MSRKHLVAVYGGMVLVTFAACKPAGSSTVKTLDNFAAGSDLHQNQCSNPQGKISRPLADRVELDADLRAALWPEIEASLKAVPLEVQEAFVRLGGRIVISSASPEQCSDSLERLGHSVGATRIQACALHAPRGSGDPRIMIDATPGAIRHSMVREFGYLIPQLFAKGGDPTRPGSKAFRTNLREIASRFLFDVALTKQTSWHVNLERFLGRGAFARLENGAMKRFLRDGEIDGLLDSLTFGTDDPTDRQRRLTQFEDFVFAEAFDSYYCNPASFTSGYMVEEARQALAGKLSADDRDRVLKWTRKVMRDFFPTTFEAFRTYAPVLRRDVAELAARADGRSSLALTDPSTEDPATILARSTGATWTPDAASPDMSAYQDYARVAIGLPAQPTTANPVDALIYEAGAQPPGPGPATAPAPVSSPNLAPTQVPTPDVAALPPVDSSQSPGPFVQPQVIGPTQTLEGFDTGLAAIGLPTGAPPLDLPLSTGIVTFAAAPATEQTAAAPNDANQAANEVVPVAALGACEAGAAKAPADSTVGFGLAINDFIYGKQEVCAVDAVNFNRMREIVKKDPNQEYYRWPKDAYKLEKAPELMEVNHDIVANFGPHSFGQSIGAGLGRTIDALDRAGGGDGMYKDLTPHAAPKEKIDDLERDLPKDLADDKEKTVAAMLATQKFYENKANHKPGEDPVCRHYSATMAEVLKRQGVEAEAVAITPLHAVVRVKINGKHYYVDPLNSPPGRYMPMYPVKK